MHGQQHTELGKMEYAHISAIGYAPYFSQQIQLYRSHEHLQCRKLVISWTEKSVYRRDVHFKVQLEVLFDVDMYS
jgi:hypothetical protein